MPDDTKTIVTEEKTQAPIGLADQIADHDAAVKAEIDNQRKAFESGDKKAFNASSKKLQEITGNMSTAATAVALENDQHLDTIAGHSEVLDKLQNDHDAEKARLNEQLVGADRGHAMGSVASGDDRDGTQESMMADLSSRPEVPNSGPLGHEPHRLIDRPLTVGANG